MMSDSIIKYRTTLMNSKIEVVNCIRETESSVFLAGSDMRGKFKERREGKKTEWQQYHDTWSDAHSFLINRAEKEVLDARHRLEFANGRLGNIKGMKPPSETQQESA